MMECDWFKLAKAIGVRMFLCVHVLLCVWRVRVAMEDEMFWLMTLGLLPLVAESFYTIIKRGGDELLRFSPCIFFYLGALLPGIWLLELDKTDRYIAGTEADLEKEDNSTGDFGGPSLNPAMWIIIVEELMPYVVILSRWGFPRGKMSREQLSEILFAFIGIAADIMEFFSLFGEEVVRKNKTLGYCVLSIWSLAVMQFTMTVTIVNEPKRARKIKFIKKEHDKIVESMKFKNELFAIFLVMIMQDLPFVIMRLYTIITYDLITYSLIFFTSKNILIILLLLYKVGTMCQKRYWPGPEDEDDEDDEEMVVGGRGYLMHLDRPRKERVASAGQVKPKIQGHPRGGYYNNTNEVELKQRPSKKRDSKASELDTARDNGGVSQGNSQPSNAQKASDKVQGDLPIADQPRENASDQPSQGSLQSDGPPSTEIPTASDSQGDDPQSPPAPAPASQDSGDGPVTSTGHDPEEPEFKPYVSVLRI